MIKFRNFFFMAAFAVTLNAYCQIDAGSLMGVPTAVNLAELNAITAPLPNIGSIAYNNDDNKIYMYTPTGWVSTDLDIQNSSEVTLSTAVDSDGDTTNETTVQQVIDAITPITSKAARIFYPPSIAIDASTTGTGRTVNLYQEYLLQYTLSPAPVGGLTPLAVASIDGTTTAPPIPTYNANELYYYVTYADPAVFGSISIDGATGIMTYSITATPADFNSLINVVFVVK